MNTQKVDSCVIVSSILNTVWISIWNKGYKALDQRTRVCVDAAPRDDIGESVRERVRATVYNSFLSIEKTIEKNEKYTKF